MGKEHFKDKLGRPIIDGFLRESQMIFSRARRHAFSSDRTSRKAVATADLLMNWALIASTAPNLNHIHSPAKPVATAGDLLIVAELRARLVLPDLSDNLIDYLGGNTSVAEVEGWPIVPSHLVEPGKFNSPHAIATDERGNICVAEWLIGGRFTKLLKSY